MRVVADPQPLQAERWQDQVALVGRRVGVPTALAIGLLTAVGVALGLLITEVLDGSVGRFDLAVAEDLAASRAPTIDAITGPGALVAGTVTVTILWVGAMAVAGWRTRSWVIPIFLLVAIGGEKLTYLFTGLIVGRPRPPVETLGHVFSTSSFPSGHVGSAITLYGGIAIALLWHRSFVGGDRGSRLLPAALGLAAAALTGLVAFSRLSRGHHYPSDVVWGAVLGLVWLLVAWRLVLRPVTDAGGPTAAQDPPDVSRRPVGTDGRGRS